MLAGPLPSAMIGCFRTQDSFVDTLIALTQRAPAAALLLAAMAVASLLGLYVAPSIIERCLFRPHALVPQRQYPTIVTGAFVHADLPHLLFNAFTFWVFGFGLERRMGTAPFVGLYAFGLLISSLGTWVKHRHDPGYATLGASGAILAVLFASIVYAPGQSIFILPIPVPIPAPLFAVAYLAYTVYASRQRRGRINHDAHLGGALAGIAYVALTDPAAIGRLLSRLLG
jgi:membrane associated rhomboid family serine protease